MDNADLDEYDLFEESARFTVHISFAYILCSQHGCEKNEWNAFKLDAFHIISS